MRCLHCGTMIVVLTFSLLFAGLIAEAELLDWVVAVVNGQAITHGELREAMNALLLQLQQEPTESEMKEIQEQVLNRMIDDRLLLAEAKRQGISISDKELNVMAENELQIVKSRYDNEIEFRIMVERMGLSEAGLKREIKDKMMREYLTNSLIQRRILSRVEVSDEDLARFQDEHPEQYANFQQVRISHILLRCPSEASSEESRRLYDKAQAIGMRVRSGERFEDLAMEFSEHETSKEQGGDLGFVKRGELFPEIENCAMSMSVGDISDPIRTKLGFHIIQVTGRRSPREYLISVKAKEELEKYLEKLREKAHIEVFDAASASK